MEKLLKFGNQKLPESIGIFNLPAGGNGAQAPAAMYPAAYGKIPLDGCGTCAGTCAGCYALNAERQYKDTVRPARIRNYKVAAGDPEIFKARIIAEIEKRLRARVAPKNVLRAIRVHESGDFFSASYVRAWRDIAAYFLVKAPALRFYAYTKRLNEKGALATAVRELATMDNFTIIDSCSAAGRCGLVNYGTIEELRPAIDAGAKLCPCHVDAQACGRTCFYCAGKIAQRSAPVFVKH